MFCVLFIEEDKHNHDQDLEGTGALDHLEEEDLALLIIEDPGELGIKCYDL